jgi:hypothetical protein
MISGLNTATSSPSSTPTENVLNGTLTASSSAPQNNHQQQKNNGVSFQQPGNEGQFPFGMQPNLAKLGFQMPIDFSNVFNLFEKVATPHFNPANLNPQFEGLFPNHHSLLPPGSSYASSIQQHPKKQIVDQQGALSQISQFLNTQQKATLTKSPSPIFLNENRKEGVQEMSNSRGIKRPLSNHNTSDSGPSEKKRVSSFSKINELVYVTSV